jgi:Zn-dependent protease
MGGASGSGEARRTATPRGAIGFQLASVSIAIHWSFWATGVLVSLTLGVSWALVFIAFAFIGVLAHELGHALMIRRFGGRPRVLLYALGGLTWGSGERRTTTRQVLISVAGPASGLLIGLPALLAHPALDRGNGAYVAFLWVTVNVGWSLFNLLPILPMDGGSTFDALWRRLRPGAGPHPAQFVSVLVGVGVVTLALTHRAFGVALLVAVFVAANVVAIARERETGGMDRLFSAPGPKRASADATPPDGPSPVDAQAALEEDLKEGLRALERHDGDRALAAVARARERRPSGDARHLTAEIEAWARLARREADAAAEVIDRIPARWPSTPFLQGARALVAGDGTGVEQLATAIVEQPDGHAKVFAAELIASEGATEDVARAILGRADGMEQALRYRRVLDRLGRSAHALIVDEVLLDG